MAWRLASAILPHRRYKQWAVRLLAAFGLVWLLTVMLWPVVDTSGADLAEQQLQQAKIDYNGRQNKEENDQNKAIAEEDREVAEELAKDQEEAKAAVVVQVNTSQSHLAAEKRHQPAAEDDNVIAPPRNPEGPGEMGRPVRVDNPDPDTKRKLDEGWQRNAFNQYVSDMISVHRSLPDFR